MCFAKIDSDTECKNMKIKPEKGKRRKEKGERQKSKVKNQKEETER